MILLPFCPRWHCFSFFRATPTDDEGVEGDTADDGENCNEKVGSEYLDKTRAALAALSERHNMNFELLEQLLTYIESMEVARDGGAILCFFPGWNSIFTALKHFQAHPKFGSSSYRFLPLHSNLPRNDQWRVFDKVPQGTRKVIFVVLLPVYVNVFNSRFEICQWTCVIFTRGCCLERRPSKLEKRVEASENSR